MKKRSLYLSIAVATSVASGCSNGNQTGSGSNSPIAPTPIVSPTTPSITIDDSTTVPVINGFSTAGKIFIHNNSNQTISGIQYSLSDTSVKSKIKALLSTVGVNTYKDIEDKNGFILIKPEDCSSIPAGGSCAINFVTPNISVGQSGSTIIKANFVDTNDKLASYNSLINYQETNINEAKSGVNFAYGYIPAVGTEGTTRYVVGYMLGTGENGTTFDNVNLELSDPGHVAVSRGFANGSKVAVGAVIPVEFLVQIGNSKDTSVKVTPRYYQTDSQQPEIPDNVNSFHTRKVKNNDMLKDGDGALLGASLNIGVTPLLNQPHLNYGAIPNLNLEAGTTATITVINNGNANLAAGGLTVTSSNPTVSVTNGCSSGLAAFATATCTISFAVNSNQVNDSGSSVITYSYGSVTDTATLNYYGRNIPAIYMTPSTTGFMQKKNESTIVDYVVGNPGTVTINANNITFNADVSNAQLAATITNNTCTSATFAPGNTCTVSVRYTSATTQGYTTAYLKGAITFNSNNYAFISKSVSILTQGIPHLTFTNPTAGVTPNIALNANGIESRNFIYTVKNDGDEPAVFSSYLLNQIAGSSNKPYIESTAATTCAQNQTLTVNSTCNISVRYGSIAASNTANESGSMSLLINYGGGIPNNSLSESKGLTYQLYGNDAYVLVSNVGILGGVTGLGTSGSPYLATGATTASQGVTLTYQNPSVNYNMDNFSLNVANLESGIKVVGGTCGYGSTFTTLAKSGGTCTLQLAVDKDYLSRMYASTQLGNAGLIAYPKASWLITESNSVTGGSNNNAIYFFNQSAVSDNGGTNTGYYQNYVQASMAFVLSASGITGGGSILPGYTNAESVTLTITPSFPATGAGGATYTSLNIGVARVDYWLESVPVIVSGSNCTITGTFAANCIIPSGSTTAQTIKYFMPTFVNSGVQANIPLVYSNTTSGQYVYLNPAWQYIRYQK